jgi:sugar phosphate permease
MQTRIGNLRWGIAILLGVGIVINYFDRVNLSVAANPLITEYHLSEADLGIILSSFLWSYAILQIPIRPQATGSRSKSVVWPPRPLMQPLSSPT